MGKNTIYVLYSSELRKFKYGITKDLEQFLIDLSHDNGDIWSIIHCEQYETLDQARSRLDIINIMKDSELIDEFILAKI